MFVAATPGFLRAYWVRLEASPLGYRLARGTFWGLTGGMISRLLTVLASIIVARVLGKQGFGEFGIIQSTVAMFAVFAGFGMGMTSTKYVAEFRQRDPRKAGRIIGLSEAIAWSLGIVIAITIFSTATRLARALGAPQLSDVLRVGSLLLLFTAINGAQMGVLAGFESFKKMALVNLVSGLAAFPLVVAGAIWGGLKGTVWGLVTSSLVNCIMTQVALHGEAVKAGVRLGFRGCLDEWRVLYQFSLPLLIANLMVAPVNWVCSAVLFKQPDGNAEMGAFTAANQWFTALLFLPTLLGQSVLPMLSERLGASDHRRSFKLLKLSIGLNSLLVVPIVLLGFASPLIMTWYGEGFSSDWLTFCIVLLTAGLLAVQMPVGQIIIASGRIWLGLFMNIGWALVYLFGTWLWVGHGAAGVAAARLTAYVAHALWTFWFALSILRGESGSVRHD